MPNRLAAASSPYLLQHKDNPVDWYEWGEEAFAAAAERDVPVLLSVGYSACHWCHVMAHESFEDGVTAAYMNTHFVNVKVDREERPDVDRIYMDAVQMMTGHGGWPMTVFLTPTGEPFFAGTYFPKDARGHHPSFMTVLSQLQRAWQERRGDIDGQADRLATAIRAGIPVAADPPDVSVVEAALTKIAAGYDWEHGGFGGAPKFPQAPTLELLARVLALDLDPARRPEITLMLRTALDRMAAGGIYDHLGGGFARYAVDQEWLVPHFEKMLYDNALLARIYLRAWQLTGVDHYRTVAEETIDYLLRDLRHPDGGLFSAEDADSEGVEGKFYVWEWSELEALLGDDAAELAAALGASPAGNFEGANILHQPRTAREDAATPGPDPALLRTRLESAKRRLFEARESRVRPGRDDKVIAAWNGLALRALAEAGAVLGRPDYLDAGRDVATFIGRRLTHDGRLLRSWREGVVSGPAFCDDYGAMAVGLFALYQATGETTWYREAERLTREMLRLFADPEGGFFATGNDAEQLIARPKNLLDNPTPADNSLAAEALQMLAAYTGDPGLDEAIAGVGRAAGNVLAGHPQAAGHLLAVLATSAAGIKEIAIVGTTGRDELASVVWEQFRPNSVLATAPGPNSTPPLLVDRTEGSSGALAYVCRNFVCDLPVSSREELRRLLRGRSDLH